MASPQGTRVSRPDFFHRLQLAWSTRRYVDGVWVGSWRTPRDLRQIEDALLLIKQHSRVHYSRVLRDLERVWVFVLPSRRAEFNEYLRACILDERYVAGSTLELIASTIVHEATHARLSRCGIKYKESLRSRIEAICLRRELAFAAKLPNGEDLKREITSLLEWCGTNADWFSNSQFREREKQDIVDALRYMETPEWIIGTALKLKSATSRLRRLFRSAS